MIQKNALDFASMVGLNCSSYVPFWSKSKLFKLVGEDKFMTKKDRVSKHKGDDKLCSFGD